MSSVFNTYIFPFHLILSSFTPSILHILFYLVLSSICLPMYSLSAFFMYPNHLILATFTSTKTSNLGSSSDAVTWQHTFTPAATLLSMIPPDTLFHLFHSVYTLLSTSFPHSPKFEPKYLNSCNQFYFLHPRVPTCFSFKYKRTLRLAASDLIFFSLSLSLV